MNAPKKQFAAAAAALVACGVASAAVIRVPADVASIQGAIDAAAPGDEVQVSPGTYVGSIDFRGKAIRVIGVQGAAATIVDGGGSDSVVRFFNGETPASVLSGFTLRNGNASFGSGGGVLVASSSPTIEHNVITGNLACSGAGIGVSFGSPVIRGNTISVNAQGACSGGTGGGGVALLGAGNAVLTGNVIENNRMPAADGGGIALFAAGTPTLTGNIIRNNVSGGRGGGVSMVNDSNARMVNNLVAGNEAAEGGGVAMLVPSGAPGPQLVNNTVADNRAARATQVFTEGFVAGTVLSNNIFAGSGSVAALECSTLYTAVPPLLRTNTVFNTGGAPAAGGCVAALGANGNLTADPRLLKRPAARRYQLDAGSPAIDAGDNAAIAGTTTDLAGKARVVDGNADRNAVVDMGAYEAARRR